MGHFGKVGKTDKGFNIIQFEDRNGESCSLQESSDAADVAVWLGMNDPSPTHLVPGGGSKDYPLPKEVWVASRMLLTWEQVKELVIYLQRFVDTGSLVETGGKTPTIPAKRPTDKSSEE